MKLVDFIFCEDIRFEINNKLSLIGVFSDQIILQVNDISKVTSPFRMRLAALFRFKIEEVKVHPDKFELEYFLNDKAIIKMNGAINISNPQLSTNLALTVEGITVEPGNLGFIIKLFNQNDIILSEENMSAMKISKY